MSVDGTLPEPPPGRFDDDGPEPSGPVVGAHARHFELTDLGNAERLVSACQGTIRYSEQRKKWLVFSKNRWAWDHGASVMGRAKTTVRAIYGEARACDDMNRRGLISKHAFASEKVGRLQAMITLAQSEPGVPVDIGELDADPWLLNCANGTLDLRTGKLREHRRGDLLTKLCSAEFIEGARSDLWDRFLETLTGGDEALAICLQRAIGYALFGAWREKCFWFGYGPANGGKSTFLGALCAVLGDYAVNADADTWMQRHNVGGNRGDLTRLLGARLVVTIEVKAKSRFDEQLMKKVTGGDAVTACAKFENEIEFQPACALWFGANDRPTISDDDDAFWSRVRCVPFTNVLPAAERIKDLKEQLVQPEHASAVLAWAVEGCKMWQRDGLGTCAAIQKATGAYRKEMERSAGFLDDWLVFDPRESVTAGGLRAAYENYCREEGMAPLSARELGKKITRRGGVAGTGGSRLWTGVGLAKPFQLRPGTTAGDDDERALFS